MNTHADSYKQRYYNIKNDYKHLNSIKSLRRSQIGGGIEEVFKDFIEFRKRDLKEYFLRANEMPGIVLTATLYREILDQDNSDYNKRVPLIDSVEKYIRNVKSSSKWNELGLNELLSSASETDDKSQAAILLGSFVKAKTQEKERDEQAKLSATKQEVSEETDEVAHQSKSPTKNVELSEQSVDICAKWDVQKIYDGAESKIKGEGSLFLGGFETGADIRYGLGKICIPRSDIKLVITIMQDSYLAEEMWQKIESTYSSMNIKNVQIKTIIDYKIDEQNKPDIDISLRDREKHIATFQLMLNDMVPLIDSAISKGENVLVHCIEGKSRSVSLVAAWLAKKLNLSREEAFAIIKSKRHIADPNKDYIKATVQYLESIKH
jgi:hypothetical protein